MLCLTPGGADFGADGEEVEEDDEKSEDYSYKGGEPGGAGKGTETAQRFEVPGAECEYGSES